MYVNKSLLVLYFIFFTCQLFARVRLVYTKLTREEHSVLETEFVCLISDSIQTAYDSDNEYVYCQHTSKKLTGCYNCLDLDYTVISNVTFLEF
jgi:hypothetical protein